MDPVRKTADIRKKSKIFEENPDKELSNGVDFIFFGTSQFAIPILNGLKTENFKPKLIVTAPDKPAGRGLKLAASPVKLWAQKNTVPFFQPEKLNSPEFISALLNTRCLTAVAASYGKIIPKTVLDIFPKGILNVHPSLLPRWRGADPIRAAMLAGDKESGISIILMDEKMDHGPILKHKTLNLNHKKYFYEELEKILAELGGELLVEVIPKWIAEKIEPKEQDHLKATYTKKIMKEDGHIKWSEPAEIIERKIRALNPWPGTYSFWNGKRIKIIEAKEINISNGSEQGSCQVLQENGSSILTVNAAKNAVSILKLQLEGKKPQNAKDFINGYPDIIGAVLN
jgi:methionyl-tRNA formyltransferase